MRFALFVLFVAPVFAQKISLEETYKPTTKPDRVVLTFAGDPATSLAVTWRTSTEIAKAYAEIAVAEDGPDYPKSARRIDAKSAPLKTDASEAHYHSAMFTGLKPETKYAYRVGSGEAWSEWHQFKTASDQRKPLTFIYFGDAQNDILSMWSRVVRDAFRQASNSHFILHAGDLVNRGSRDVEWGEWHEAAGWINAMTPIFPTPGNHEYSGGVQGKRAVTEHWRPQFTLPENGLPGLEETCYYVDIQGVRMISMNSNEMRKEQAEWLDKTLTGNPNKWTIVTFHHPVYSTAKSRDNKDLRESWQPIFDKHGVDLVLQGHDHTYGRSNPITFENSNSGTNARSGKKGTVYVVSVSGPKMYELMRGEWMMRAAEQTQLYQVITIDGDKLTYESRTGTGRLYDAFELRKRAGRANEIINKIPANTPERLRSTLPAKPATRD